MRGVCLFPLAACIVACAHGGAEIKAPAVVEAPLGNPAQTSTWASSTQSPSPPETERDARETALRSACGREEGALTRVARDLAVQHARGLGSPDLEVVVAKLRAAGEPHVRPRLIVATGQAPIDETKLRSALAVETRTRGAAGSETDVLRRARCGLAIAKTPHGGEVLVALAVDALADLSPLPTRARTGQWLSLDAHVHVPARSAKLVVLGPRGAPRTVPTSLEQTTGAIHARFALDQPGAFTVQLIGEIDDGPRPLLEARIFADVMPSPAGEEPPAPGEEPPAKDATRPDVTLARMIAAVRSLEGLAPLTRDENLDTLARAHAERMAERRALAHDVGDGDFRERFETEGTLDARAIGENVAHAPTVGLAHRALYASPSHRINLLRPEYTHVGIGVARVPDGSVYVCEAFASAHPGTR